nr:hypothetical protein L203_03697 [Cryptococcus depauperatus CBS 7841]
MSSRHQRKPPVWIETDPAKIAKSKAAHVQRTLTSRTGIPTPPTSSSKCGGLAKGVNKENMLGLAKRSDGQKGYWTPPTSVKGREHVNDVRRDNVTTPVPFRGASPLCGVMVNGSKSRGSRLNVFRDGCREFDESAEETKETSMREGLKRSRENLDRTTRIGKFSSHALAQTRQSDESRLPSHSLAKFSPAVTGECSHGPSLSPLNDNEPQTPQRQQNSLEEESPYDYTPLAGEETMTPYLQLYYGHARKNDGASGVQLLTRARNMDEKEKIPEAELTRTTGMDSKGRIETLAVGPQTTSQVHNKCHRKRRLDSSLLSDQNEVLLQPSKKPKLPLTAVQTNIPTKNYFSRDLTGRAAAPISSPRVTTSARSSPCELSPPKLNTGMPKQRSSPRGMKRLSMPSSSPLSSPPPCKNTKLNPNDRVNHSIDNTSFPAIKQHQETLFVLPAKPQAITSPSGREGKQGGFQAVEMNAETLFALNPRKDNGKEGAIENPQSLKHSIRQGQGGNYTNLRGQSLSEGDDMKSLTTSYPTGVLKEATKAGQLAESPIKMKCFEKLDASSPCAELFATSPAKNIKNELDQSPLSTQSPEGDKISSSHPDLRNTIPPGMFSPHNSPLSPQTPYSEATTPTQPIRESQFSQQPHYSQVFGHLPFSPESDESVVSGLGETFHDPGFHAASLTRPVFIPDTNAASLPTTVPSNLVIGSGQKNSCIRKSHARPVPLPLQETNRHLPFKNEDGKAYSSATKRKRKLRMEISIGTSSASPSMLGSDDSNTSGIQSRSPAHIQSPNRSVNRKLPKRPLKHDDWEDFDGGEDRSQAEIDVNVFKKSKMHKAKTTPSSGKIKSKANEKSVIKSWVKGKGQKSTQSESSQTTLPQSGFFELKKKKHSTSIMKEPGPCFEFEESETENETCQGEIKPEKGPSSNRDLSGKPLGKAPAPPPHPSLRKGGIRELRRRTRQSQGFPSPIGTQTFATQSLPLGNHQDLKDDELPIFQSPSIPNAKLPSSMGLEQTEIADSSQLTDFGVQTPASTRAWERRILGLEG